MKKKNNSAGSSAFTLIILILIFGLILYGVVNARTVRVKYVSAKMNCADASVAGTKILYLSDLKITNARGAKRCAALISKLNAQLEPDLIIIGGDLTGSTLLYEAKARIQGSRDEVNAALTEARSVFLREMNRVNAKYGIFAVLGDGDIALSANDKAGSNIRFLENECGTLTVNGGKLALAGYASYEMGSYRGFEFSGTGSGPMIVVFHNPNLYQTAAGAATKRSGGSDCSGSCLFLSGHTLNGQISLRGKALLHSRDCETYPGESYSDGTKLRMLISSGIGTELLPLRYGTAPCAYLITLEAE